MKWSISRTVAKIAFPFTNFADFGVNIKLRYMNKARYVDFYSDYHYLLRLKVSGISIQSLGGILKYSDLVNHPKTLETSSGSYTIRPQDRVQYSLQYIHIPFFFKTTLLICMKSAINNDHIDNINHIG